MGLYGIYGTHTQEACPLYNDESRKYLLRVAPTMAKDAEKSNVKILNQFHSGSGAHISVGCRSGESSHNRRSNGQDRR